MSEYFRLRSNDRKVLAAAYHNAALPISELSKLVGLLPHTTRRVLQRLSEERVISYKAFVDVYQLGYTQYELYYAISARKPKSAEAFVAVLLNSPKVSWIGEYSGEFQYAATVCCRTADELQQFVETTTDGRHVTVLNKQLTVRLRYTEFPLKQLSPLVKKDEPLIFGKRGDYAADEKDCHLLSLLSTDCARSSRDLSRLLSLSQTAVVNRIRRMEEAGVIAGYTLVVDFSRLGLQAFNMLIRTKAHTADTTGRIFEFAKQNPYVSYLVESIGAHDYQLGVLLSTPAEILALSQEVSERLADEIVSVTTLTAFDYKKVSRFPFAVSHTRP